MAQPVDLEQIEWDMPLPGEPKQPEPAEGLCDVGIRYRAIRSCHVRATGQADGSVLLEWPGGFRQAMRAVCAYRELPHTLPARICAAPSDCEKHLLIWPAGPDDQQTYPVRVYSQERWAKVALTELFHRMGLALPDSIVIEIPADLIESPTLGPCLSLDLHRGEFMPKKSKPLAVARMPDE